MKHTLLLAFALLCPFVAMAQEDPVVMRIGDSEVRLSEFTYAYHKNYLEAERGKKSLRTFADDYLDYQLKVKAAIDAGLDTLPGVRQFYRGGHAPHVVSLSTPNPQVEKEARSLYESARVKVEASGGMIKPAHILLALPQNASKSRQREVQRKADSLYQAIKAGADFTEMAREHSDDHATAQNGGELPWMSKGQIVEGFERVAYSLSVGEVSRPFLSEFGYHIILLKDKAPFYPYEARQEELRGYVETSLLRKGVALDEGEEQPLNLSEKMDTIAVEGLEMDTPATKALSPRAKEFRDAALVYEMTDRTIWQPARNDERALENYFKRHKKDFRWKQPRFSGVAFYVRSYNDLKKARRIMSEKPASQWKSILEKTFNNGSTIGIRIEAGLFSPGDHPLVDRDIYKGAVHASPYTGLHIGSTYGKILRKGPEDYTQVRNLVLADYQEHLEREWVEELHDRYQPIVYWEELTKAL